ncbi:tRNA glutamyl-Q(34) synthetase GluQRS [Paraferrimonas sedimenticola]|uniref:Glutamyl-Q tRNA(Asp) synthetase n=1 Tax=Paraferrimonas sedimenticola TaxID=375674 RepID=A0AA37RUN0_9GAMM|nr:tRNA glutamyl-Q(34) synthetase GluQRS [Paraferrimonas sedimenticola]GLP95629.1 glutamyl-Q tRNA(Asp) synthetase [Paraferrimonas sedimenticola]
MPMSYIGRFAPSPSGPLHFGSLVAALGSYLRAKQQGGRWLVRIDDLDPPREVPGSADSICQSLQAHGLHWDDELFYQSQRFEQYQACLDQLMAKGLAYGCHCTRKRIQSLGGLYDGHCRELNIDPNGQGIRLHNQHPITEFDDQLLGQISIGADWAGEDFLLKRRDGYFAYQLAVVLDDHYQGITEVVRGADLLETSARHISLYRSLNLQEPKWAHLPLALMPNGQKLSKQNQAPELEAVQATQNLFDALLILGQTPPDGNPDDYSVEQILEHAVAAFDWEAIPTKAQVAPSPV